MLQESKNPRLIIGVGAGQERTHSGPQLLDSRPKAWCLRALQADLEDGCSKLPSSKLTVCYRKSQFLIGKSTMEMGHFP